MTSPPRAFHSDYGHDDDDDDDNDVITSETVFILVMLAAMCLIGVAGNTLVLYVFGRRKDRLVSTLFIVTLAAIDLITCILIIPFTMYMEYVGYYVYSDIACKIYQFLITSNIPFSAMIMVAIAVDRYFAICRPLKDVINVTRAKMIVLSLAIVSLVLGVCVACMFGVCLPPTPLDNPHHSSPTTSAAAPPRIRRSQDDVATMTSRLYDEYVTSPMRHAVAMDSCQEVKADSSGRNSDASTNRTGEGGGHHFESLDTTGLCKSNTILLSSDFQYYYHKVHMSMYAACLVVILISYVAIYRSVVERGARRRRRVSRGATTISRSPYAVGRGSIAAPDPESGSAIPPRTEDYKAPRGGGGGGGGGGGEGRWKGGGEDAKVTATAVAAMTPVAACTTHPLTIPGETTEMTDFTKQSHQSTVRRKPGHARGKRPWPDTPCAYNLRVAAMLFVVTLVFVFSFLPAWLMIQRLVPYESTIFYLYFANNVANPVIYSFMNKNFRESLREIACRSRRGRKATSTAAGAVSMRYETLSKLFL